MKKYLIGIASERSFLFTTISGDIPTRPFTIANNLWNYATPWHAAQRLELLAKAWEKRGRKVKRFYGDVWDMRKTGNTHNVAVTVNDYS